MSEFATYEEFWPYYVLEHANKTNRLLHFIGTTGAIACLGAAAVKRKPALIPLALVVGYGFAWAGHFLVEGNRPATFKYPLWSLRGDFRMWSKMARGQMDREVLRHQNNRRATEVSEEAAAPSDVHSVN